MYYSWVQDCWSSSFSCDVHTNSEMPVQRLQDVHCLQDFSTSVRFHLVQQHLDVFGWGSLCNTMVSSLVSTFWLNILAITQSQATLQHKNILKSHSVIYGTRQRQRKRHALPGHSFQRLNYIFPGGSTALHEFKVVFLWK